MIDFEKKQKVCFWLLPGLFCVKISCAYTYPNQLRLLFKFKNDWEYKLFYFIFKYKLYVKPNIEFQTLNMNAKIVCLNWFSAEIEFLLKPNHSCIPTSDTIVYLKITLTNFAKIEFRLFFEFSFYFLFDRWLVLR